MTMPINEQASIQDDLTGLGPVEAIRTIQGLLLANTSDEVRGKLIQQGLRIAEDCPPPRNDTSFTPDDLLESPFFLAMNLRKLPEVQANNSRRRLSGNMSKTARAVLDGFHGYDVTFEQWEDFETLMAAEDVSTRGTLRGGTANWGRMVYELLYRSCDSDMGKETGEVQELTVLHQALRRAFEAFDFAMKVKNGSDDDVTCSILSTGQDFMVMEGKESACLPRRLSVGGHHLCSFGFATKLARTIWKAPPKPEDILDKDWPPKWHREAEENNNRRPDLQRFLNVTAAKSSDQKTTSVRPSARSNLILRNFETVLSNENNFVQINFGNGLIEPHDPVNLWAAVMQACHYAVKQGRGMTIVQSARMWWFIQLSVENCVVRISTASKVGSRNFLSTVVRFLQHAYESRPMSDPSRRKWEKAIVRPPRTSPRKANRKGTGPKTNRDTNDGSGEPAAKRRLISSPGGNASNRSTHQCRDTGGISPISFEDEEDMDSCFGYDEFGMAIPWFDQIGDPLDVLGKGRSGDVRKVVWKGQDVALKTFALQFDDCRSLESVYQHELEVLRRLKDLWGEHVPRLLFHKPWPTSPMIGLELGDRLPDDMSTWCEADLQKANETVSKIKALGLHQTDFRGSNFIRLRGNKIGMIDFESVEEVTTTD